MNPHRRGENQTAIVERNRTIDLIATADTHLWADPDSLSRARRELAESKSNAVSANDQELAKELWCLEKAIDAEKIYIGAFEKLKEGEYYDAWMDLGNLPSIEKHMAHHCREVCQLPPLQFAFACSRRLQTLFPYRLFLSPAFLHRMKECSICHAPVSIRVPCGHIPGEIYDGEMCYRIINEVEVLEVSIVENPVQKYSVLFLSDGKDGITDHYDYSVLKYLMKGLTHPFHGWDYERTDTRHPHHFYSHTGPLETCPCNSGEVYRDCCLRFDGVLKPHISFRFEHPPPDGLPRIVYPESRRNT